MGLKGNETLAIMLVGLGVVVVIGAALMFRIWHYYVARTKNKAVHLHHIRRRKTTTNPQRGDLEAGEAA